MKSEVKEEKKLEMNGIRGMIYKTIEVGDESLIGKVYDILMIFIISLSLIPLMFKRTSGLLLLIDLLCAFIFVIDYILRLITADYKLSKGAVSFLIYPFTPFALIDIISILPSLGSLATLLKLFGSALGISSGLKLFRLLRLFKSLKVLRVFKSFRYSKSINTVVNIFKREKDALSVVFGLTIGYVVITALILFNAEPTAFNNFFEAIYFSVISLVTIGYGDIVLTTVIGRMLMIISSIVGIAIVALPSSIITAGYMAEIQNSNSKIEKE